MLLGVIIIIIFLGSFGLLIWWSDKQEAKESRESLSSELRNHFFIKRITAITKELRDLKGKDEILSFFKERTKKLKSDYKLTQSYLDTSISILLMQNLGIIGGLLGEGLFHKQRDVKFKIEYIDRIQVIWSYYLFSEITKPNISKEEKRKVEKEIENQARYLLNLEILLITDQNNIKDAWKIILGDKVLTRKVLNQLSGEVRRILFPEKSLA